MEDRFKEQIQEFRNMTPEEFKSYIDPIRSDVWSFPEVSPPRGAEKIGEVNRNGEVYHYYMDREGTIYFENDSGFEFKKKMERIHLALMG